jgi:hypothetical protein
MLGALTAMFALAGGPARAIDPARAQAPTGQITGQVTDAGGMPLGGITVGAAPIAQPDAVVQTLTDAGGRYVLDVAAGDYDVAFNTLDPVNDGYDSVTFGGPGPGPGATCTICIGRTVTVVPGGVTSGIGAALASAPFPQTGFVRPLSGKAIRVLGGRLSFRMGCHVEPTGCLGTARLRLAPHGPTIATVRVVVFPGRAARLVFKVPAAVVARARAARRHSVAALVEITTPPAHTITRFRLVVRP